MNQQRPPKVFLPQMPSTFDKETGIWVPKFSFDPARVFGEIVELLPPGANRAATGQLKTALRERINKEVQEGDYFIPVGDPSVILISGIYISRVLGGKINLLRYDNRTTTYIPMEIIL